MNAACTVKREVLMGTDHLLMWQKLCNFYLAVNSVVVLTANESGVI